MLGQHCQSVMNYFFRNLHLHECQLDELWTFIRKKEDHLSSLEKLAEVSGDAWVWIAFSPVCKLVPAWVVGKRTLRHARRLLFRLKSATDGHIPFFTSDALPHYADALLEVYGVWGTPPRQGTRGRLPKLRRYPPPDLCYAIVDQGAPRLDNHGVELRTRLITGASAVIRLRRAHPGRYQRTRARSGGPCDHPHRLRDHRAGRCGLAGVAYQPHDQYIWGGAQQPDDPPARTADGAQGQCLLASPRLSGTSTHARVCLHFVIPHRGLRQRLACPLPTKGDKGSYKKWKAVTPAMAAGLTDHVWTMDELLSFRVPPQSLW